MIDPLLPLFALFSFYTGSTVPRIDLGTLRDAKWENESHRRNHVSSGYDSLTSFVDFSFGFPTAHKCLTCSVGPYATEKGVRLI